MAFASAWRFFCFTASLDGALFLPRGVNVREYELTSTFIEVCARLCAFTLTFSPLVGIYYYLENELSLSILMA